MCKVLFIAGIKKTHHEKVKKLLKSASDVMSISPDNDGVGYAAITSKGKIYGEKWLEPKSAFKIHNEPSKSKSHSFLEGLLTEAGKFKSKDPVYESFGDKKGRKDTVAVVLHTRNATVGEKSIKNTHPFVMINRDKGEDIALVHNGTILNHYSLTKKLSGCDSEVLLHEYVKEDMNYNPWGIESLAKTVKGTYTVGTLSSYEDVNGVQPVLDIFKSNKDLYAAYCPDIETAVFATTSYILEKIATETGFKMEHITELKDGFLLRLNAITGERLEDPISFTLSSQTLHEPTLPAKQTPESIKNNVIDMTNKRDLSNSDMEELKKKFEEKHPDLYDYDYEAELKFTEQEQEILDTLATSSDVDLRALKLVQLTLGS